jgi:hypothetical protein
MSLQQINYTQIRGGIPNVLDFGAKGDGSTDDTASIQLALTTAGAGSTVYFPEGVYYINGTLTLNPGQIIQGAGWFCQNGQNVPTSGSILVQHSTSDIPLISLSSTDSLQQEGGGLRDIALVNNVPGSTVGTGFKTVDVPKVLIDNLYVAQFNVAIEQGKNCYQWSVNNVKVLDTSICLYAHDEGEDSTYTACSFRTYRATGKAIYLANMSQTNVFVGCDISDNLWGCFMNQGDTNGNGTGTPYPMSATFINCQFEDNIYAAIGTVTSNQSASSSLHPTITAINCRAYISGTFSGCTPNNGQSFIYAQHAAQIKIDNIISNGYSYGLTIGQAAYGYNYYTGSICGPTVWSNPTAAATWGTSKVQGGIPSVGAVSFFPGDHPLVRLTSTSLNYTATNYTKIPFTTIVSDYYNWYNSTNIVPLRNQTVRFRTALYIDSAPAGRYTITLYKNGSPLQIVYDQEVSVASQPLLLTGEALDVPNGTTDSYYINIYSSASWSLDTTASYFYAETLGS